MPGFDLTEEPWVPVERDGELVEVGLREALLRAHEIDALSFTWPTQFAAILRQVLLAIVIHAVGIPRTDDEWGTMWKAGALDTAQVETYLDQHRERFDLFDDKAPFGQVAGLRTAKGDTKPSSLLIPTLASGNNVPLYSARSEADPPELTPAEAARWLLHSQSWDTAAIKSGAEGDPAVKSGKTTGNPTGPLGRFGVVIPVGDTLFETILLNIPVRPDGLRAGDRPQWCAAPSTPIWETRAALGLLDLLTWQSRRIRLMPEETSDGLRVREVIVAAGDRLLEVPDVEPHAIWNLNPKAKPDEPPRRPRRLQSGKSAWQGLDALLAARTDDEEGRFEPTLLLEQVGRFQDGALPPNYALNVATVGVEYGNQQAVVENIISDMIPLPVVALRQDTEVRGFLQDVVQDVEKAVRAANILAGDLRRACGSEPLPWDRGQRPEAEVIQALDPYVRRLLAGLSEHPDQVDRAREAWHKAGRTLVLQVVTPLLNQAPPTAFLGRTQQPGSRPITYRLATAETAFRRALNEVFHLARQKEQQSEQEAV